MYYTFRQQKFLCTLWSLALAKKSSNNINNSRGQVSRLCNFLWLWWNLELLTQLTCIIFLSWLEKCFEVTENVKKFKCDGGCGKLRQKICLLRQSLTICVFFFCFFGFFWQLLPIFNFWKEDWALGCVSTDIWHFSNIS